MVGTVTVTGALVTVTGAVVTVTGAIGTVAEAGAWSVDGGAVDGEAPWHAATNAPDPSNRAARVDRQTAGF
jgi:hypothetical protein